MKVKYFAWMKRTVGVAEEEVSPPSNVTTVGELVAWLRGKSPGHAEALAEGAAFGAAVDKRTATMDAKIAGVTEVAFFPPFTGG
jgi:molybdopterin synthase sulfur carrier subunit